MDFLFLLIFHHFDSLYIDHERKPQNTTEMLFINHTRIDGKLTLPAARTGHCLVKYGDKIFSTGGYDEKWRTTSNVWQLDAGNNFAKTEGQE